MSGSSPRRLPRVLHVSQPVEAGVAVVVQSLVADQIERGWDVAVACPPGVLAGAVEELGARPAPWRADRSPRPGLARRVGALAAIIRALDPDVCHLHSSMAGLAGRLAIRGRHRTLFQPHAWSFHAAHGALAHACGRWECLASRWTDRVVCVSAGEASAGREAGVSAPISIVPNGIDLDHFDPARWPTRENLRRHLGLPSRPIVLCPGRLCEQKGQDLLLEVWADIVSASPEAILVLVGDGPDRDSVRSAAIASPSVRYVGKAADLAPWYLAADVVVVPSRWEGMALVPIEAAACARPVVAFDVAGIRETVGDAGAVVPAGALDELVRAIVVRLEDPDSARIEGRRGRARTVTYFDRRGSAAQMAEIVEDLAQDDLPPARRIPRQRTPG